MGTTRGNSLGIPSEERLRDLDATCAALLVQHHEHCLARIPDLTSSLVGLLQFPGLDSRRSWLPVATELPVPHGVTPTLLPIVRQIQDQYITELQRVNALCQDHYNQWVQLLRRHAQQDRPVTIWECRLHHDAVQHKFDGVRCWLKRLYSDWIDNLVHGNALASTSRNRKKRSSVNDVAVSVPQEDITQLRFKKTKLDAGVHEPLSSDAAHGSGGPSVPTPMPPPPPPDVSAPPVQQLEEELGSDALWPELASLRAEQEARHVDGWFEREACKAEGSLDADA